MERSLASPDFYMKSEGEHFGMAANYPLYIRFLDMKRRGNWHIYNAPVYGILYNNTLPDIKYKYGEYVADVVCDALRKAFQKYNK